MNSNTTDTTNPSETLDQIEKRWNQMIKYYREYAIVCSDLADVFEEVQNEEASQHQRKMSIEFKEFADFYEQNREKITLEEKLESLKVFDGIEK